MCVRGCISGGGKLRQRTSRKQLEAEKPFLQATFAVLNTRRKALTGEGSWAAGPPFPEPMEDITTAELGMTWTDASSAGKQTS